MASRAKAQPVGWGLASSNICSNWATSAGVGKPQVHVGKLFQRTSPHPWQRPQPSQTTLPQPWQAAARSRAETRRIPQFGHRPHAGQTESDDSWTASHAPQRISNSAPPGTVQWSSSIHRAHTAGNAAARHVGGTGAGCYYPSVGRSTKGIVPPNGEGRGRMTISIDDYLGEAQPVRKKEPQYIAVINRNSCTSCNACATMCPVDCIYEVPGAPTQAFHQIDTARCIGCQMCYRVPSESTGPWTLEICPWNAIDLIYNPNFAGVKNWGDFVWQPKYAGQAKLNFAKLEEVGYSLYLNRAIDVRPGTDLEKWIDPFVKEEWSDNGGETKFAVLEKTASNDRFDTYTVTEPADAMVADLYAGYNHMFLD